MGTLTVSFATAAATVYSHSFTIPDADMNRIIAAYQPMAGAAATPNQVATWIVQAWIAEMSQTVVQQGSNAALAAIVPTPPISAV